MPILNSIFGWIIKKRIHQIELFKKYPEDVQNEWMLKLVQTAQNTEYGKKYGFKDINNYDDFKKNIPINDYESIKHDIIRIKQGEQNILWPTEIKWFAKSSGTTSDKSKFIPVSKESLTECHFKGGKDMLALYYHQKPDSEIFAGKSLVIGGSSQVNRFSTDSYYGDLSAILIKNLPFWVENRRVPELSIALMDQWEEKIEKLAQSTINEDVTNISGVPSWTLILLNRILEITGKKNIKEVWPNLELFIHGGVSFIPYKQQFENIIAQPMNYLETYNASEGFFGIQDDLNQNDLLLMLDYGIFYEFIPEEDFDSENPKTVSISQVETNKNYALVISTNGGLWRYKIGDTIMFTSVNPYKIKVTGRTKMFINICGEEVIIDNAEKAIAKACEKTGALVNDYTGGPIYLQNNKSGGHEWIIEFEKYPDDINYFTEIFDNALKNLNSDYEAKRFADMALKKPIIHPVEKGTFYKWMKSRNKLGGQNKVPRLANNRKYLDQILQFINETQTL
jgi:hypothetical protein